MVDTLLQLLSLLGLLPKRGEKNCLANTPPNQVGWIATTTLMLQNKKKIRKNCDAEAVTMAFWCFSQGHTQLHIMKLKSAWAKEAPSNTPFL